MNGAHGPTFRREDDSCRSRCRGRARRAADAGGPDEGRGKADELLDRPEWRADGVRARSRMGWRAERRLTPMDSTAGAPTVQVVLAPGEALGAHEVHRLLTNVRRGGGLVFALDGGEEIGDSLGLDLGRPGRLLSNYGDANCPTPSSFRDRTLLALPPEVNQIVWRRPPPRSNDDAGDDPRRNREVVHGRRRIPAGKGTRGRGQLAGAFHQRRGAPVRHRRGHRRGPRVRIRAAGRRLVATNGVRRISSRIWHARRQPDARSAVSQRDTPSGRFLGAGADRGSAARPRAAPRPIPPKDPERIIRRSPLEHADALGHAYADVGATRTATARIVSAASGVVSADRWPRRRGADDASFSTRVAGRVSVAGRGSGARSARARRAVSATRACSRRRSAARHRAPDSRCPLHTAHDYSRSKKVRASCAACATRSRHVSSARTTRSRTCSWRFWRADTC